MNWEKHFRSMKRRKVDFGTVGGSYTLAELRDLLAAKDIQVLALLTDGNNALPDWEKQDTLTAEAFHSDMTALGNRYLDAKAQAQAVLNKGGMLPENMNMAGDAPYRAVLYALNPAWESHGTAPGSIEDLTNRLRAHGAVVTQVAVPQPRASSDVELSTYKTLPDVSPISLARKIPTWVYIAAAGVLIVVFLPELLIARRLSNVP